LPTVDFNTYYVKFRPSPEKLIFARYIFSIAFRIALLISGIGILFRKEIFRKAAIFIGCFTIATIYWKHPVICFKRVLIWKVYQGVLPFDIIPRINLFSWICASICYIFDIGVNLCLIYFLTRPKVKEQFA